MSRAAPRIAVTEIQARVFLEPSGGHQLEVGVPSGVVAMRFSADQVAQLKSAIAVFEAETIRADGGRDFYNRKIVPVEFS